MLLLVPIAACGVVAPHGGAPSTQGSKPFFGPKDGVYITALLPYATVGGDFDGDSVLVGGGAVLAIPEVDPGFGWGGGLGFRSENSAFEVNYQRTDHDVSFLSATGEATYNTLNLDFKQYFIDESRLQPNLLLGLSFPWFEVEDGSAGSSGSVADAKFTGIGANLGGGLTFYPHRRVGLSVQGGYRFALFTSASGADGVSGSLEDSLDGSGAFASFGVTFTF